MKKVKNILLGMAIMVAILAISYNYTRTQGLIGLSTVANKEATKTNTELIEVKKELKELKKEQDYVYTVRDEMLVWLETLNKTDKVTLALIKENVRLISKMYE